MYDLIIVGGGPAGLSAALYMARAQYRTLVLEREKFGGQITITSEVVNYPGVKRTDGTSLTETMREQAESFGAEFRTAAVQSLELEGEIKRVVTDGGTFEGLCVLLATGASPRMAGFAGEKAFQGHGVAYCATCDGEFFTGKEIFVIGGGFSAAEEAIFLTKYAKHVTVCVRRDQFSCAKSVADRVLSHPKISVLFNTQITEAGGDTMLRYAVLRNTATGEETRYTAGENDTFGIFVFTGYTPETALFADKVRLTEGGYLDTDKAQQTSVPGVFGAGDVCDKPLRQVVTAVSDGAIAATSAEKYAAKLHDKLNLPPFEVKKPEEQNPSQPETAAAGSEFFSPEIVAKLGAIFERLTDDLTLCVCDDGSSLAQEMKGFTQEIAALGDRLHFAAEPAADMENPPCIDLRRADGSSHGFFFHGIPGGHELNSFVVAIYNAAGPGQAVTEEQIGQIMGIGAHKIEIAVTLSCTMCPPTVMAASQIALRNPAVTLHVLDANHFPAFRQAYHVMSVPCIVIDGQAAAFGKKSLDEMLALLA